ncbi:MAG: hypothetical protein ACK2UO_02420 [Caldilineaceae bacterium]
MNGPDESGSGEPEENTLREEKQEPQDTEQCRSVGNELSWPLDMYDGGHSMMAQSMEQG